MFVHHSGLPLPECKRQSTQVMQQLFIALSIVLKFYNSFAEITPSKKVSVSLSYLIDTLETIFG